MVTTGAEAARLHCAAKIVALVEAIRGIPDDLAPCSRAKSVAVREQIYYGWERPLAAARGAAYVASKYEVDGWWSVAAAELVNSGGYQRSTRQLEREHVEPVGAIVADLLAVPRTVGATADLLDARLVTCTVLADEHRRLGAGSGWDRYTKAGIAIQFGLSGSA
ncbi:MAG: hypothetical protein ACT4P1_11100 [Sporichthyaceae bacterium]